MQKYLYLLLLSLSCTSSIMINEKPMYGEIEKKAEYLRIDSVFIANSVSEFHTRDSASRVSSYLGFEYLNKKDPSTAMKRFNQAWLLDSTNSYAYWGMAIIVSTRDKDYHKAMELFERGYKYHDKNDTEFLFDFAVSNLDLIQLGNLNDDKKPFYRDRAIELFTMVSENSTDDFRKENAKRYILKLRSY